MAGTPSSRSSPAELDALCAAIRRGTPAERLIEEVTTWRFEPLARPLARLGQYARALAGRLGKGDIAVEIEGGEMRIDAVRFGPLWSSLVHVVRNAVDHGIEMPAERAEVRKAPMPRMCLRARTDGPLLVIEVEDDGRGIDWARVRTTALRHGVPSATEADLVRALLSPGFTTRTDVTLTSGRGLGLSAVQDEVLALGGSLTVRSAAGVGSCWCVSVPRSPPERPVANFGATGGPPNGNPLWP